MDPNFLALRRDPCNYCSTSGNQLETEFSYTSKSQHSNYGLQLFFFLVVDLEKAVPPSGRT